METKNGFNLMSAAEFETWIQAKQIARTILYVQIHHTYIPNYSHFRGNNHFAMQLGMKNTHMGHGWGDIGQHFSIFPDGKICTGRTLESNPACIYGFNSYSICIENVGWFDAGKDVITPEQKDAILRTTAALCKRFQIPVDTDHIVYHHWFDLKTGARKNGEGSTKSCPGTAFFGGNKVADAQAHFIPAVKQISSGARVSPVNATKPEYGCVKIQTLNIRKGPGTSHGVVNTTPMGSVVRIWNKQNNWLKISQSREEWIFGNHVQMVQRGVVNTDILNVRSGPGTHFEKLDKALKNEEVFIFEEKNGWCRISLADRWVSKQFIAAG